MLQAAAVAPISMMDDGCTHPASKIFMHQNPIETVRLFDQPHIYWFPGVFAMAQIPRRVSSSTISRVTETQRQPKTIQAMTPGVRLEDEGLECSSYRSFLSRFFFASTCSFGRYFPSFISSLRISMTEYRVIVKEEGAFYG